MKKIKYTIEVLVMLSCWVVAYNTLTQPELEPNFECEIHAVDATLDLPTECDIIGIDLMLFEPLPKNHTIKKHNNLHKK